MDALMAASMEELEAVDEVGPRVAQAIQEFFAEEKNRQLVEKLRQAGLTFTAREEAKVVTARRPDVCAYRHHGRSDARRGEVPD